MNTHVGRWVHKYWPTFLYIGSMCAIYILLVLFFMNVLWPWFYQNAEPTTADPQSTTASILSQRVDFKGKVQTMYFGMGALALILYLLYCTNGWLSMTHSAHVKFSKDLRFATVSCFLTFALDECATYFIISAHENWWDLFKLGMIAASVLSCAMCIMMSFVRSVRKESRTQNKKKFPPGVYSGMAMLLFVIMLYYDGIIALIRNGVLWFLRPSVHPILSDSTRFVLQLNVDILLPLFLVVPLGMLWLAMWYASPSSASTPPGGRIYALVHTGFPTQKEEE